MPKVTALQEIKNFKTFSLEQLEESLMTYEMQLESHTNDDVRIKDKGIALKAQCKEVNDDSDDDKEIIMLMRKFKKYFKNPKYNGSSSNKQGLAYFCEALKSLVESWMMNNFRMDNISNSELLSCKDNTNMKQLGETMLATLDCLIKIANEMFDIMEEDEPKKEFSPRPSSFGKVISSSSSSNSDSSFPCSSCPVTPKSVQVGAAAPPPPPLGAGRSLRSKATTKLKRSTQLSNLYRTLKGKVEGSSLKGKSCGVRTSAGGAGSTGAKQGMADALAEMKKRSPYFQQIEQDVQKYTQQIIELRSAISNFKTKEMTELIKFHKDVDSVLENLTDESQVLSRFEGFPKKKLEATRMAAALYHRLDSILTELQNWNIMTPVGQHLDKVERYFNKIKTELDAVERTKDEESKKFKGHNIEFDFYILVKIKEAMVDVSSNCMELALKERRNDAANRESGSNTDDGKRKEFAKLLWRAFQFAFRVYTFAGGHDDRADNLTRELAKEIDSDQNHP
ncbi:uncharacterized protein At4g04980-like [Gastrolobium bilobum]|uniref:uncharacterized protein At4g04980-like n=1 Tax=Gastrolobium bilobum TaxID=150636 RepID=UPI002AB091CA|nr:uncharacterized protein At4g04980-like [Gastrolobium bilobum]